MRLTQSENRRKAYQRKLRKTGWHTYDGWPRQGRHVRKGERSRARDKDGRALFHIDQTDVSMHRPNPDMPGPWEGFDVSHTEINDHFFSDGYMDDVGDR